MPRNQHIDIPGSVPEDSSELPAAVSGAFDDATLRTVEALRDFLDDKPDGVAFMKLEERLRDISNLVVANLLACVLAMVHRNRDEVAECKANAREQAPTAVKDHGLKQTRVQFSSGIILRIFTPYMAPDHSGRPGRRKGHGRRGKGGGGCYPVLVALGIRFLASPLLQSLTAASAVRSSSFEEATADLASHGCNLDPKTVRRLALAVGQEAIHQRAAIAADALDPKHCNPTEFAGKRLMLSEDGGRMQIRKGNRRGRKTKKGRHKTAPEWKEPKGFTIYEINDKGKKVRVGSLVYDFTLGDADEVLALLISELRARGASSAKEISIVADGAEWIWNRVGDIARAIGWETERITCIVDFYHATEHLGDIMKLCAWMTDTEKQKWIRKMSKALKRGEVKRVIAAAEQLCGGTNSEAIEEHIVYFEKRIDKMQYHDYIKVGIACGSGVMESAVRRIVNMRFKGASISWLRENAEPLLHLRSYLKAGRWDEIMKRTVGRRSKAAA